MRIDDYKIKAKLYTVAGEFNISSYVKDIQIIYSLNLPIPQVAIVVTKEVIDKYFKDIIFLDLTIETYQHSESPLHIDKYSLIPILSKHDMYSPTRKVSLPQSERRIPNVGRDYMMFYMRQVYDAVNYNVHPQLLRNKKPYEVVDLIKPPNVEEFKKYKIQKEKKIPQIYIKKEPFLKVLNYIDWWYGFSSDAVIKCILPSKNSTDTSNVRLYIINTHQLLKSENYEKEFVIRTPGAINIPSLMKQELGGKTFVVSDKIQFSSHTIDPTKYTIVAKPHKILFKKLECDEKKLINKHGSVHVKYDRNKENVIGKANNIKHVIISEHPSYKCCFDPITSHLGYEYTFVTRGVVKFENIPTLRFVWPSEAIKIKSNDPDQRPHTGMYIVESVLYRLTREKGKTWQLGTEVTIIRTNMMKNDVNLASPSEPGSASPIIPVSKVNDISNNLKNIQSSVNGFSSNVKTEVSNIVDNTTQTISETTNNMSQVHNSGNNISQKINNITSLKESVGEL